MLGFDIKAQLLNGIKKEAHEHPEIKQGLEKIDKGTLAFKAVVQRIPTSLYPALLNGLNNLALEEAHRTLFTPAEIVTLSEELAHLPEGLDLVHDACLKLEAFVT